MKITKIETFTFWVDWCNWMFVRIETDKGLVGWGEASLHGALESVETAIREFAPHLIGEDPAGPERHFQFERHGYFVTDRIEHEAGRPVFNRITTLRDSWSA